MKRKLVIILCTVSFFLVSCVLSAQGPASKQPRIKRHSVGVGMGIPYGGFGFNLDFNPIPFVNLSGGIGSTILAGIGYNAGLKVFLAPPTIPLRPRICGFYGTNTIASLGIYGMILDEEAKSYNGITAGGGVQWMWGRTKTHGMDLDILYIATSGLNVDSLENEGYYIDQGTKFKIALGYRYAF